jgi:hypothetical protein
MTMAATRGTSKFACTLVPCHEVPFLIELPNGPKAVLLTNQFWHDHFHGRGDVLGSVIPLDGQPHTIIGVMPQSFVYLIDVKIDLLTTLPYR